MISTEPRTEQASDKVSLPTLTAMVVGAMVGAGVFSLPAPVRRRDRHPRLADRVGDRRHRHADAGLRLPEPRDPQARARLRRLHLRQGRLRRLRGLQLRDRVLGELDAPATPSTGCSSARRSARSSTASATATRCWRWSCRRRRVALPLPDRARRADAAVINRIVTVFKIIPILVFIVVLFFDFDAGVFADNWTAPGTATSDERAGPQHHADHDVRVHRHRGRQRLLPLRHEARGRRQGHRARLPERARRSSRWSRCRATRSCRSPSSPPPGSRRWWACSSPWSGDWGEVFISVAVIVSVLGAYLAWTLMAAEVMYIPARTDDFPEFLGQENATARRPITALVVTSLAVQGCSR